MTEKLGNSLASKAKPFLHDIEAIETEMDSATGEHAAAARAGYRKGDEDVRPRHLRLAEQERADAAALEKVGRGSDPVDTARS